MTNPGNLKLLFIINPRAGKNKTDWPRVIQEFFKPLNHATELFNLPNPCTHTVIKQRIEEYKPDRVVSVGGDGTVKLVAECLFQKNIPIGILPAGSANGMAKELNIPLDPRRALDAAIYGFRKKIHLIKINNEFCIHLSDIGFNAFVIKKFETNASRGMWVYVKAAWKVLWNQPLMQVQMKINNEENKKQAAMIVMANATKYGSGALINPAGKLDDDVFEVIVIKKVSFAELFKMWITHRPFDPEKTEVFQTSELHMRSRRKAHFQVDGEYLGKVNTIDAALVPDAIEVIVPDI